MASSGRTFLSVERSLAGRRWVSALDERGEAAALAMAQLHGLPDLVARVLAARGVAPEGAPTFLAPRLRDLMPDPSELTDMDRAAARLADAVERRERVAIFGDYDVDGAASSALLKRSLVELGLDVTIRIPDRISEGYGPSPAIIDELIDGKADLIVCVDCGTASFEPVEAARRRGIDVVVLDHHQTGATLPAAAALVNPNRQDDLSGLSYLCAAGVVFMALVALSRELRRRGRAGLSNLLESLDLVALATICDVVPLTGLNRAFVTQGLKLMRAQSNVGVAALARVARLSGPIEAHHLGFILGPRINAGGRIGDAALGSRLLCLDQAGDAQAIAEQLDTLNTERQAMERSMLADAIAEMSAEIGAGSGPAVLVAGSEKWHPGIVGLIAARLKERFRRPSFAIAFRPDGLGTGSGRSIAGIDLGAEVRAAVETGILVKGGGHAMAAGITIHREQLGSFRAFLEERIGEAAADLSRTDSLKVDGAASAGGLTAMLYETIEKAGPYGSGHTTPVFALARQRIAWSGVVGADHVRASFEDADGRAVKAIAFRAADSEAGRRLLDRGGRPVHVAGTLSLDRFQGREEVRLRILDVADSVE